MFSFHAGTAFDAEEEAVTALRLGLHYPESEIQIPVTDYFRMGNDQNNQARKRH